MMSSEDIDAKVKQQVEKSLEAPSPSMRNEQEHNPINIKKSSRNREPRKVKPCYYFVNCGYCRYGRECRYFHPRSAANKNKSFVNSKYANERRNSNDQNRSTTHPAYYYQNSSNYRERSYRHFDRSDDPEVSSKPRSTSLTAQLPSSHFSRVPTEQHFSSELESACVGLENVAIHTEDASVAASVHETSCSKQDVKENSTSRAREPKVTFQSRRFRKLYEITIVSDADLKELRSSEISYLQKRFPKHKVVENEKQYIGEFVYTDDFSWFYDGKPNVLRITLDESYPKNVCEIEFMETKYTCRTVVKNLNQSIKNFLAERHKLYYSSGKVELVASAFVKWLETSFDDLYNEALKKYQHDNQAPEASRKSLRNQQTSASQSTETEESEADGNGCDEQFEEGDSENLQLDKEEDMAYDSGSDYGAELSERQKTRSSQISDWVKSGTEVKLLYLELHESVGTIECQKIAATVRCSRCKTLCEFSAQSKCNWVKACSKCHQKMSGAFYSSLLHSHCCTLGYLHLSGCQAVDLAFVQCKFQVACLNCNKNCTVDGVNYGRPHITWCLFCNKKFSIGVQAVKFHQLGPTDVSTKSSDVGVAYESSKKKSRDPAFKEGKPLPSNGACKHYKKSHRWLRFPCCGKAYACDLCHEENEDGHEMKFASRMICGFCSKEQPYAKEKSCDSCSAMLTKKSGAHWEGGKGCRDRTKMSRDDKHKYSGVSKTVARKVGAQSPKKKK